MSGVLRPQPARPRAKGSSRQSLRTIAQRKAESGRKIAGRGQWCQGTTECFVLTASNPNQCFPGLPPESVSTELNQTLALSFCLRMIFSKDRSPLFRIMRQRVLRAVIRVTRQDGRGPINLFQQHDANHLMRPGRGAERHPELCLPPQIGRKSVRAADHENSVGHLFVPPAAKMAGKSGTVEIVAAFVERHHDGFRWNYGRNRGGFLGHPGCGVARAAFANFMNFEAAKAEFAADVVESFAIALGQFPLRTLLQPAD